MRRGGKVLVVDPPRCGCTDCITHYSVPANELTDDQLAFIRTEDAAWVDRTWWQDDELEQWLARQAESVADEEVGSW